MPNWSYGGAAAALDRLPLNPVNRGLARNWLNAWRSQRPPTMELFWNNSDVRHRAALAFFRAKHNVSLHCVAAGQYYKHVLGFDIANKDILAMVKQDDAQGRLSRSWQIVEGAALVSDHLFESLGGGAVTAQGLCLPFGDVVADGSRFYLAHTSWRPQRDDMMLNAVRSDFNGDAGRIIEHFAPVAAVA